MIPLLTFASGLLVGAVGIRVLKKVKTPASLARASESGLKSARQGLDQAESGLRKATISGLGAIEKSSAALRGKLEAAVKEAPKAEEAPAAPAEVVEGPRRRRRRASPAVTSATAPAKAPRKRRSAKAAEPEATPPADGEGI